MFSLIISIIAIALVAALALASIYYGGSAFQEGSADAEASTVINQGQQIQAAWTMADVAEETMAVDLALLTDENFLKELPRVRAQNWTALDLFDSSRAAGTNGVADVVSVVVNSKEICEGIEERFNNDTTVAAGPVSATTATQAFGCVVTGTSPSFVYTAYYKL